MNLDIAELVAAMITEAGGSVVLNAETFNTDFSDKMIAIDYNGQKDIFLLTLVDTSDIDFGDKDDDEPTGV